jgi:Spy/CpxP family protein refolding chaperone
MKRAAIFTVILALLVAPASMAFRGHRDMGGAHRGSAFGPDGDGMNFQGGMLLRVADKIGLDEGQKEKISSLMQKNGLERIEKRAALDKARLNLRYLRMNNAPENDVLKAMDEVGRLETEMSKMRYRHRQDIRSILSQDQLDKLNELRQQRQGGFMKGNCDGDGPHGRKGDFKGQRP